MKKKHLKIIALTFAIVLIVGLCWFANALLGNPVSKMLASNTARQHLAETYGGTDYYVDRIAYNFKDGNYHAFIKSETSIDIEFSLYITMAGKLRLDTYEDVTSGFNTARRIDQEYRTLTDSIFDSPSFPYGHDIGYGTIEIYPGELIGNRDFDDVPTYALNQDELILDKIYDVRELGRQAGHLVIYVEQDSVSIEEAAEIMVDVKRLFDDAGIPFAAMDFVLQHPRPEEGKRPEGEVRVIHFPYEEIYADDMVTRVREADKITREYYAMLDDKSK